MKHILSIRDGRNTYLKKFIIAKSAPDENTDDVDIGKNGTQERRFRRLPRAIVFDIVRILDYAP